MITKNIKETHYRPFTLQLTKDSDKEVWFLIEHYGMSPYELIPHLISEDYKRILTSNGREHEFE